MNSRFRSLILLSSAALLTFGGSAFADDVTDSIDEALKAYQAKDFAGAAQSLETATQLIKQKRAEGLTSFLPETKGDLDGWDAEEATSQAAAAGFFGGGVTAECDYTKGDAEISVKFMTDSPLMQGVMMMMGNPMFAGSDGGKLIRLKGQRAIFKYSPDDKEGSVNVIVAGTLLVQIEGNHCTDKDLMAFANAIDYPSLASAL